MSNFEIQSMGYIQCDNPGCGYESPTETTSLEHLKEQIGTPCPKCGSNLLTQEDYDDTAKTFEYLNILNEMSPEELQEFNDALLAGDDEGAKVYNKLREEAAAKIEAAGYTEDSDLVSFSINVHDKEVNLEVKPKDEEKGS
jgi:HPt (histidine-containing phosphotransfer) domain-containing protein